MSSRWELDDGIKSIKSAWQREHTARANLEKMLENAEAENEQLHELLQEERAENAKLREQGERLLDKTLELGTENDKLRELVRRMARALNVGDEWCDRDCDAEFGCDLTDCPIEREMRELGVEP